MKWHNTFCSLRDFRWKRGARLAQDRFVAGVLYSVFDYGDEPQVNEIHGRAIMRQLVCSGYCYSMLISRGPHWSLLSRTRWNEGTDSRHNRIERERARFPFLLFSYSLNNGVVMHEEADSGMHKSRSKLYSPDRSNLSGMYHRSKSTGSKKEKRAEIWRGGGRRRQKEERTESKKSLYRIIGRFLADPRDLLRNSRAEKL